jgi:hypothetical protein
MLFSQPMPMTGESQDLESYCLSEQKTQKQVIRILIRGVTKQVADG